MKKLLMAVGIISAVFFSCGSKELPEGAVAVVNKTIITEDEFNKELNLFKEQYEAQGMTVSEGDLEMLKPELLNSLIVKVLLLEKVEEMDITPDEEGIASQIEGFKAQFDTEEEFAEALKANNFTEEALLKDMREQSVIQQVLEQVVYSNIVIDEEIMQAYYEENKDTAFHIPESVEASHILIMVNDTQTKEEALQKIQEVKAKIDEGMDFGEAALEYSEGPTNVQKGYLGQFGRGQMVPEFEAVAFDLELGVVSDPVLTQFGYHLILITDKNPEETLGYEEAKAYIEQQMKQEASNSKTNEYLNEIREKASVILPEWALPQEEEETVNLQTTG